MRYTYIAICLVAGALFWGCDEIKEPSLSAAPLRVRVELPERMQFTDSILVQGNIESQETADISSRTAGNLDRIPIDEGVRVKAGDLLFEIDRVTLENDLRSQQKKLEVAEAEQKIARIALDFSRTAAEKTRIDYQRALQLRSSEAVSADTLECAKLALDEALTGIAKAEAQANYSHAKVEQEKAAVAMAEKELADSTIRAPFDAMIVTKSRNRDEYVSVGEKILRLENLERLELVVTASAIYYNQVTVGKTIAMLSVAGKPLELVVSFKSPSIDAATRTFTVKIALPVGCGAVGGQSCEAKLVLRQFEAVGVPSRALVTRSGGGRELFVADNGCARAVRVMAGIVNGSWTEIENIAALKGLPVVVSGQSMLNDGDRITPINPPETEK